MDIQALNRRLSTAIHELARKPYLEYIAMGLFFALAVYLVHGHALGGSWRMDDGDHLRFASQNSPWQYFFNPEVTRAQSGANVTPWNAFFYDINLSLFGMNEAGHYAHLLLLIAIGTLLFYAVMRQWLPAISSLAGAMALLLGKPTIHIAQGLMHGHYAAGFAFTMLSILCWTRYMKGGSSRWLWVSAGAYLLATSCKEIYVPLVVLLPLLPVGSINRRLRTLVPFLAIAIAYVGWRYTVLGHLLGGYRPGGEGFDIQNSMRQLTSIPRLLTDTRIAGVLETGLFLGFLAMAAWRNILNWPLIAMSFGVVMLPLVPLTILPGIHGPDRYLFLPWVAVSACIAVICPRGIRTLLPTLAVVLLMLTLGVEHQREERRMESSYAYWDSIYRFALVADKQRQALFVGQDDGYKRFILTGARVVADMYSEHPSPGTLLVVDDRGMGLNGSQWRNLQFFQFEDGHMSPMPAAGVNAILDGAANRFQRGNGKSLQIEFTYNGGMVRWKFGPNDGKYYIEVDGAGRAYVPRDGSYPWQISRLVEFKFCYENVPENWIGCSPRLSFDPKNKIMTWTGKSSDHPAI